MQNEQDGTLDAFGRRLRSRFVPVTAAIPDEWDEMLSALDRPLADTVAGPEAQTPQD